MKKVLITGGGGFLGGFMARALADRGATVHLIDNLARGRMDSFLRDLLERPSVKLVQKDLRAHDALAGLDGDYDVICHFAALLGVQNVLDNPYPTLRDNIRMLDVMLEFAMQQSCLERFVFTSTSEVYAGSFEATEMPIPTPEDVLLALPALSHPRTSYMLSKIYGEAMVRHSGVPYTIVRPHNVYGPRMGLSHVIPQLLEKAHRAPDGGCIEVFSVNHTRSFCYIDDAVRMLVACAEAEACRNQVLNLGTQTPEVTIGTLAETVIATVGKRLRVKAAPATPGSPGRRCPCTARMRELTGVTATVGLEEGVRRTYEWYARHVFDDPQARVPS